MEILSPAGGKEQLTAAVRSGADAVYLGTKNFNARRNADNFTDEELAEAIKYCHARNVKVYVALNTLVTDNELEKAVETVKFIAGIAADAVIVQDMAILKLVKEIAPDLPLHASTQMSIHNVYGAMLTEQLGFCRLVPARELSKSELADIKKHTQLELEVFVHGALCMSFSGQCYLSSVLGARSANRGMCAQPCRLNFKSHNGEYALSLKDLSLIDKINELKEIGADSLKIEGRMKRPEYVAVATGSCKKALNGLPYDKNTLKAVFSRSGFTDSYFTGKRGRDLFGYRTKDDVISAAPVLREIANSYRKEVPLVPVKMEFTLKANAPVTLTVSDGENAVKVFGIIPEQAINRETDEVVCTLSLSKCGGTPYYVDNVKCDIDSGLSIPVSAINSLRKEALEKLNGQRENSHSVRCQNDYALLLPEKRQISSTPKLYARFETAEQIQPNTDKIIIDRDILCASSELCRLYKGKLVAELPVLSFSPDTEIPKLLKLKENGVDTVYAQNLYAIKLANDIGFNILGGFSLNIINSLALEEYKALGVSETEISVECNLKWFNDLRASVPIGLVAYGKTPLMTFRACPLKGKSGCGSCNGKESITDRYGTDISLLCRSKQFTQMINPNPINMGDKLSQIKNADFLTAYFTDETPSECLKIINRLKSGRSASDKFTRGLYYKEIF